ncbi:MAG: Crp/Fnr family transcriptional regulator [Candidatus Bipolaricaulaceae bacterium]
MRLRLLEAVERCPETLATSYDAGELIYQQGAFAAGVYVVAAGAVVCSRRASGEVQPLSLAGCGDLVGLEAWHPGGLPRYRGSARAVAPTRTLFMTTEQWEEAMDEPPFRKCVLVYLADWLEAEREARLWLRDAPKGIAWLLLRCGIRRDGGLWLPCSTGLLADLLGVSRTTVRKAVDAMVEQDLVETEDGGLRGAEEPLRDFLYPRVLIGSPR